MRGVTTVQSRTSKLMAALVALAILIGTPLFRPSPVYADTTGEGFALQVSPSPLIGTLTPGTVSTFDLSIRNTDSQPQALKMGLQSFSVSESTGQVQLGTSAPSEINKFVSFSNPTFTVAAGQIFMQHVIVRTPLDAGFTYSFAINVSQQNPPKGQKGTSGIAGRVAVFTLLSVNRPGAVRKLELVELSTTKHVYEYLPSRITIKLKNSGNTLVQPKGTIYIQRHSADPQPLAAIQLNQAGGYILPGSSRILTTSWSDGFPRYQEVTGADGKTQQKLSWQGGDFTKLRFGKYVAKVVAVYDDGQRDVPINAEVTFWVIPWRLLGLLLLILLLIVVGAVTTIRKSTKTIRRKVPKKAHEPLKK